MEMFMTRLSRRRFALTFLSGAALAPVALSPRAARAERSLVIGGGPAGANAALTLAQSHPGASVMLIERDPKRLARELAPTFARLASGPTLPELRAAGVDVVIEEVNGIDWRAATVHGFSGRRFGFDRLVLAPGISALPEDIAGLDAAARHAFPAAWGSTTEALRLSALLSALPDKGHVVMRLPTHGLSHPKIALKRAITLADHIAANRPSARLTVLDGGAEAGLEDQLRAAAPDIKVDWRAPGAGGLVTALDARTGRIETDAGVITADVVNFIPPCGAATVAQATGLTDETYWCPTDAQGRSALHRQAQILGDARFGVERGLANTIREAKTLVTALDATA
jgi:hypothetical protein